MSQLTYEERYQISQKRANGLTPTVIAREIGRAESTVRNELKRNTVNGRYNTEEADQKAATRKSKASSHPLKEMSIIIPLMKKLLCKKQFSPEQISGRLKLRNKLKVSHEWIYQYIWADKERGGELFKHLRNKPRQYRKRGSKKVSRTNIPDRVGIENRPIEVGLKQRFGDFEGDTIIGRQHGGAILSLVDRASKLTKLVLLPGARSEDAAKAMIKALDPIKEFVHTITTDNGSELKKHKDVSKALNVKFFFANPYHSWERGLNENTNGLVRQYFPKGSNFLKLTPFDVLRVEYKLNNRPRKTLGYRTPNEEFLRLTRLTQISAFRS